MQQQAELIRAGGEIVNLNQIARAVWKGRTLWLNTSGGFLKLEGREASMVWAMLEDRLVVNAETGEVKQPQN